MCWFHIKYVLRQRFSIWLATMRQPSVAREKNVSQTGWQVVVEGCCTEKLLVLSLVTSSSPVVCNTNLDFPTFANYSLRGSKDVKSAIWKRRPFTFRVKAVLLTSIGNNKTRVSLWRWTLSFSGMHGSVSSVTTAQCYLASVFRQFSHLHKLRVITAIW